MRGVHPGGLRDAISFSSGANGTHCHQHSNADKHQASFFGSSCRMALIPGSDKPQLSGYKAICAATEALITRQAMKWNAQSHL